MHSQMVRPNAHSYEHDHTVGEGEDEHHHEKKSVLKKVKAKAKKIKDTLKLQGHHDHDDLVHDTPDDHDLDEEDEELVNDPEIHGVSGLHTAAVRNTVPELVGTLSDTGNYYGTSEAALEDQVSPYTQPTDLLKSSVPKHEVEDKGNRAVIERSDIKEAPYTPKSSSVPPFSPGIVEQEANRGQHNEFKFEEDPEAPNKIRPQHHIPTNYETKVTDPTGQGTKEIEDSPILQKLGEMGTDELKPQTMEHNASQHDKSIFPTGSHDQFSPSLSSNPQSGNYSNSEHRPTEEPVQSGYTHQISSATSVVADKAISAKNAVASKLGYGGEHEIHGEQEKAKGMASPVEYLKKIATAVAEKSTPVYSKVAKRGSDLMWKSQEGGQIEGQDKGVSVKGYLTEKLKPGEEDRALSQLISEALHKQKDERGEKMGEVTESEEVKRQLGSGEENSEELESTAGSSVASRIKGVVGSILGKGEETRSEKLNEEETRAKVLQESEN